MALAPTLRPEEFESALRRHVLDVWFPRCIDREHGGFLCDYDRAWNVCGPQDKLLEFQARQTLLSADAYLEYPGDTRLREAALHGLRYLRDAHWDKEFGGWFHMLDRAGRPLEAETKHTHGAAYALSACAAVYAATGEREALALAQEGFAWLERFAHDPEHGGWFGYLRRDGSVIDRPSDSRALELDTVGTEVGFKDLNVHSDLLETFGHLYRAWPDAAVRERLSESLDIIVRRMFSPATGALHFFVTPDWQPVPHLVRAGYQCHSAFRILWALEALGDDPCARRVAGQLIEHALRYLADPERGGFFYAAPAAIPNALHGQDLRVRHKSWWVQMEVLRALVSVGTLGGEYAYLMEHAAAHWRYVQRNFFDEECGGVYSAGLDMLPRWRRALGAGVAPRALTRKGDVWKDASHEGRAFLYCLRALRERDSH